MRLDRKYKNVPVSKGTLFADELADNCRRFLISVDLDPDAVERLQSVEKRLSSAKGLKRASDQLEKKRILCNSLFKILEDISPRGCFFGPHPGEPGKLGFWDKSLRFSRRHIPS